METHAPEINVELEVALQHLARNHDPAVLKRDQEQAELLRLEMLKKYGIRDLAVKLVREVRDSE